MGNDGPQWRRTVEVPLAGRSVWSVAQACGVPLAEVYAHNPGLEARVHQLDAAAVVVMPASCTPATQRAVRPATHQAVTPPRAETARRAPARPALEAYVVAPRDTPGQLAQRSGLSLATLARLNGVRSPERWRLVAGKTVQVPYDSAPAREQRSFRIPEGGSLWRIAKLCGVASDDLAHQNGVSPTAGAPAGHLLVVPAGSRMADALQLLHLRSPSEEYDALLRRYTDAANLPGALVRAVTTVESRGDSAALSDAGAGGVMQVMPGTARYLGVEPIVRDGRVAGWVPRSARAKRDLAHLQASPGAPIGAAGAAEVQIYLGTRYLAELVDQFVTRGEGPPRERWRMVIAAYNAGPGAVEKHGDVPPFNETRNYVRDVALLWQYYEVFPRWRREEQAMDPAVIFARPA